MQQQRTFEGIFPAALWYEPRIQDQMKALAAQTEARERDAVKAGGTVTHTAEAMMAYWHKHFVESTDYILFRRGGGKRATLLAQLRADEDAVLKSMPTAKPTSSGSPELPEAVFQEVQRVAAIRQKVDELRRSYRDQWQRMVDEAADRFVFIARSEGQYLTYRPAGVKSVKVFGLPEFMEGTVEASANKESMVKTSTPVAPSVVTFINAVQKESGLKVRAGN